MKRVNLCRICGLREAELPDRERPSILKRICRHCHAERLRNDLRSILAIHREAKRDAEETE